MYNHEAISQDWILVRDEFRILVPEGVCSFWGALQYYGYRIPGYRKHYAGRFRQASDSKYSSVVLTAYEN